MSQSTRLAFLLICVSIVGCGNRQAARLAKERRAIEQLRRDMEDDRRKLEGQMFGFGRKPDLSGRPGPISVMGALVVSPTVTVPQLSITFVGGDREYPALTKKPRSGLDLIESDATYLNFGCDETDRPEIAGLRPADQEGEAFAFINARVVLMCGTPSLGIVSTEIFAHQIILEDTNIVVEGTNWSHLSFRTAELVLRGKNVIRTRAVPAVHGPILMLSTERLAGDGHLAVTSEAYDGPPVTGK